MFWGIILLGIIQGLSEFLPISSSGHLVLLYEILGVKDNTLFLIIILHVATLLSVCVYYRKDLWQLIKHPFCKTNKKIIVTTIFTCLVVLAIKPVIDITFGGNFLSLSFLLTAILLLISDWKSSKTKEQLIQKENILNINVSYFQAIVIGLSQGIACIPGISRSGTTIGVSRLLGVKSSCKYSFLISIPIILASLLMEILDGCSLQNINLIGLSISFVLCFAIGLLCIKAMTNFVNKNKLKLFSFYLIILSIFLNINSLFLHWF